MLDGSRPEQRLPEDRGARDQGPWASSHRAVSACARELARLVDRVTERIDSLHAERDTESPVQRQTPSRCIVQLGPVALTIAWLQHSQDTVADGELLVAVWSGAVAPSSQFLPERAGVTPLVRQATVLWEEVLTVAAENEESWRWQPKALPREAMTSAALADACVERLQLAYQDRGPTGVQAITR